MGPPLVAYDLDHWVAPFMDVMSGEGVQSAAFTQGERVALDPGTLVEASAKSSDHPSLA